MYCTWHVLYMYCVFSVSLILWPRQIHSNIPIKSLAFFICGKRETYQRDPYSSSEEVSSFFTIFFVKRNVFIRIMFLYDTHLTYALHTAAYMYICKYNQIYIYIYTFFSLFFFWCGLIWSIDVASFLLDWDWDVFFVMASQQTTVRLKASFTRCF